MSFHNDSYLTISSAIRGVVSNRPQHCENFIQSLLTHIFLAQTCSEVRIVVKKCVPYSKVKLCAKGICSHTGTTTSKQDFYIHCHCTTSMLVFRTRLALLWEGVRGRRPPSPPAPNALPNLFSRLTCSLCNCSAAEIM